MHDDPYRHRAPVVPPTPTWWAGITAYGAFALSGLLWIATGILAYQRESWGMLGARLAVGPTAFAIGSMITAVRTRYARSAATRVAAPLAVGWLCLLVCSGALELFFATLWRAL